MNARAGLVWIAKAAVVYAALIAASVAGGLIFYQGVEPPEGFDAEAVQRASYIVKAAYALMLAALAAQTRLSRLGTTALLFALFFGAKTFLSLMEAVYYAEHFDFPLSTVPRDAGAGALTAFIGAGAAALLFARSAREEAFKIRPRASLIRRFALATALYPVAYWMAGYFIAWQVEAVREFYTGMEDFNLGMQLAFQILRGAIWAGLALAAVHGLRGAVLGRALLVGAAFSVFMAAQMLYPIYMPEPVRMAHLVEVATSNFLYGLVAALLLAPTRNRESVAIAA